MRQGQLQPIPTIYDSQELNLRHLQACVHRSHPEISYSQVETTFNELMARKPIVIQTLTKLAQDAAATPEANSRFRAAAYRKAIASLKKVNVPLISVKKAKEVTNIGQSIAEKIVALYLGLDLEATNIDETKLALARVWGAGPSVVRSWMDQGIRSLADLKKAVSKGQVTLDAKQTVGLEHYDDLLLKIPKKEASIFLDLVHGEVLKVDPKADVRLVGSYARGAEEGSDIDILIISNEITGVAKLEQLIAELAKVNMKIAKRKPRGVKGSDDSKSVRPEDEDATTSIEWLDLPPADSIVIQTGSLGRSQFQGVIANPLGFHTPFRRVDIFLAKRKHALFALLQYTASGTYNQEMRKAASKRGLLLNDKGLWKKSNEYGPKEEIYVTTEEEIFDKIGMKWVKVEERV